MARFDLHRDRHGWLLDVQSELTAALSTRIVVPLRPQDGVPAIPELNPVLLVEGEPHVMMTHLLAALPRHELKRARGSLAAERDAITRALGLLFTGF